MVCCWLRRVGNASQGVSIYFIIIIIFIMMMMTTTRQWAAVRTAEVVMAAPPQKCRYRLKITWHFAYTHLTITWHKHDQKSES